MFGIFFSKQFVFGLDMKFQVKTDNRLPLTDSDPYTALPDRPPVTNFFIFISNNVAFNAFSMTCHYVLVG